MSTTKPEKFRPHIYAEHLITGSGMASDSMLLYRWTGTHWSPTDYSESQKEAYRWLVAQDPAWATPENARRAFQAACLFAPAVPPLTDQVVIPTRSGYVHLNGTELVLRPADPALGLTHCLSCCFEPQGEEPVRFKAFLNQILPDAAVRGRVQEYIGYTLLADTRYQMAQFWLGQGANGKGVLANIVQALHGRIAAIALDQLSGFHLSVLVGASLIYVDEVPRKTIEEQRLKSMIAGECVPVDRKYRDPLSVRLRGKWLVLGNNLPTVADHSTGFWRRWDIVPFSVTIPQRERDPMLADTIINSELSGVLNWALEGLQRLQKRGCFDPDAPAAMTSILHEAKADTNSVMAWLDDFDVELQTSCATPKDNVFQHYRFWCAKNAMREVNAGQFWKRMKQLFKELDETRIRVGGVQQRMCNIRLDNQI